MKRWIQTILMFFCMIGLANAASGLDIEIAGTTELLTNYEDCESQVHSQIYKYSYTITFQGEDNFALSHWTLELPTCCDGDDFLCFESNTNWEIETGEFFDPAVGEHICGIKWNSLGEYKSGTLTFSFLSYATPTTVNWYGKGGNSVDSGTVTGPSCDTLVPVELSTFSGVFNGEKVDLTWQTGSETENLGFHVFRRAQNETEFTQITHSIIPGLGSSGEGTNYSYSDSNVQAGETYFYQIVDYSFDGVATFHGPVEVIISGVTGIAAQPGLPKTFALERNYPNPFNPETTISFSLPEAASVKLNIFTTNGRLVTTLVESDLNAGTHTARWDARDSNGNRVSSGLYIYQIIANDFTAQHKMLLLK